MDGDVIHSIEEAELRLQRAFFQHHPAVTAGSLEQMESEELRAIFERQPVAVMLPGLGAPLSGHRRDAAGDTARSGRRARRCVDSIRSVSPS